MIHKGVTMKQLLALIQVKKLIALVLTFGFLYLAVIQTIGATEYLSVYTLIIGFYFGQSTVRQTTKELE